MILVALMLLQAAAPAPAAQSDDIVVMGAKLSKFRGQVAFGATGPQCHIKASTGDAAIDRIGCSAIEICYPPYESRYAGTSDRAVPAGTRKVMRAALKATLDECFASQTKAGLSALVAQRAGGGA